MNDLEVAFQEMLGGLEEDFANTKAINKYMPPDGTYIVVLNETEHGVKEKDGTSSLWWRLSGMILAEGDKSLDGKEFNVGFYGSNYMSGLKADVAVLAGRKIESMAAVTPILEQAAAEGFVVAVQVSRNARSAYANTCILEVIDTSAVAEEVVEETTEEVATEEVASE